MNPAVKEMLDKYQRSNFQEHERALREILQEIALLGLWRAKFFEHAAFYGGTALRVLYGLDRFSEDLDFTLIKSNPKWKWEPYGKAIQNELAAYGFDASFVEKEKKSQTAIKSAFLKTPTVQELLKIGVPSELMHGVHPDALIQIRVEIDTDPPVAFQTEERLVKQPVFFHIRSVQEESLFAGKMHAALFRAWKGRVKGRDWYDIVWFIRRNIPLDLALFSKLNGQERILTPEEFLHLAKERIQRLDVQSALQDVAIYLRDVEIVERTWSREFFKEILEGIRFKNAN